jgi:hypothetical protein
MARCVASASETTLNAWGDSMSAATLDETEAGMATSVFDRLVSISEIDRPATPEMAYWTSTSLLPGARPQIPVPMPA